MILYAKVIRVWNPIGRCSKTINPGRERKVMDILIIIMYLLGKIFRVSHWF